MNRVHQHQFAETAPLEALVDGQSSNTNCWQGGVARQSLSFVRRKINKRNARRRQRVIGRNLAGGGLDHDKTIGDPAADVLGHLRLEIAVESLVTATEPGAVMPIAERVEAKGGRGHATPNSSRYRLAARFRRAITSCGKRASNRAVGRASCFIAFPIYGKLPYQSMQRVCAAGGQRQALLLNTIKSVIGRNVAAGLAAAGALALAECF